MSTAKTMRQIRTLPKAEDEEKVNEHHVISTCNNCKFLRIDTNDLNKGIHTAKCAAHPPTVQFMIKQTPKGPELEAVASDFPRTKLTNWCGEHQFNRKMLQ
jgi:hypothetical protein